jgi:hypothetical protein
MVATPNLASMALTSPIFSPPCIATVEWQREVTSKETDNYLIYTVRQLYNETEVIE